MNYKIISIFIFIQLFRSYYFIETPIYYTNSENITEITKQLLL
jgi:hypothetical protein